MESSEKSWREAIETVLRDERRSLHSQEITNLIHQKGYRKLTGATPAATVSAQLSQMIKPGQSSYVKEIHRTSKGYFEFIDPLAPDEPPAPTEEDDDEPADGESKVRVACYGLYWERRAVEWGQSQILGRQSPDADPVNFAGQKGVYLLHQERFTVYVGQTTDSLYTRLSHHHKAKQARWDKFSWFGFREVNDQGVLATLSSEIDVARLTDLLEAVLIEAMEPPLNVQRGKHMGWAYQQAPSPSILESQRKDFFRTLSE